MSSVSRPSQGSKTAGWHFAHGQNRGGPISLQQLQKMAADGELAPTDRVLRPGGKQWERAGSVPELFGNQRSDAPPAPQKTSKPVPTARLLPDVQHEVDQPKSSNLLLRLVLVGGAAFFALILATGLLAYCLIGEFSPQAATPTPEEAPPPPPSPGKKQPKKVVLTPRQIATNEAVQKGAAYLRKRVAEGDKYYIAGDQESGAHPGAAALLGLTLLESGASPSDPDVQKTIEEVRQRAVNLHMTYSIALTILFLDRFNAAQGNDPESSDARLIRTLALRLIGSQNAKAGWNYFCRTLTAAEDQRLMERLKSGEFRPGEMIGNDPKLQRDDNSIGQFVTLALWTARKHNVPVREPLLAVEQRFRTKRLPDGTWGYMEGANVVRDTSTCAALIGLAVGRGIRDKGEGQAVDLLKDDAVAGGIKHIQSILKPGRSISADLRATRQKHTADMEAIQVQMEAARDQSTLDELRNQMKPLDQAHLMSGHFFGGDNWGDLYFLWSLERLCMIYGLDKIGDVDWHEWGSDFILMNQHADGSWKERFPGVPDTCFAMLFLMRANVAKDLTDKLRELMQGAGVQPPPGVPSKRE